MISTRPATIQDAAQLGLLFQELNLREAPPSDISDGLQKVLAHPGTHIWVAEDDGRIGAMATLHVLPNLTYGGRPYALIENVASLNTVRGQGFGQAAMRAGIADAWAANAYKIMLLTGRRNAATGFYEKLDFSADEKHGMVLRC